VPSFLATMLEVFDRLAGETLPDGQTRKLTVVPAASLAEDLSLRGPGMRCGLRCR
jgi:hypothetical protein